MPALAEKLKLTDTLTFDCYGTLIDWKAGLNESLFELIGPKAERRASELYRFYVSEEARVEAEAYRPYREVLALAAVRAARKFKVDLTMEKASHLADMVADWPPFPDTVEALKRLKSRFRLGVLSNIDGDIFAGTARRLDVAFDFVVTAQDVSSYKPALGHFERMLRDHARRESVVHVAQSVYHDGQPTARLGLAFVWINRYNDTNLTGLEPLATLPDLRSLAAIADGTVGTSSHG